jgi:hypothetical protein
VTRQNYIGLAYCGDPPKPWASELEADLPVELQDWSQFERRKPLPPQRGSRRKPRN